MADTLPVVGVTKGTANGATATVDFDFANAPHLRDEVTRVLDTALGGDPAHFGAVTINRSERAGARHLLIILQFPTQDDKVVDVLLRILANLLGYTMHLKAVAIDVTRSGAAAVIAAAEAALSGKTLARDPGE
jgi:hypothetical protein